MKVSKFLPQEQSNLFAFHDLIKNFFKLYYKNKLPNKILLNGLNGIGKSTFAYHLINFIFSKDEDYKYDEKNFQIDIKNKSYNLIKNNSHPNLYVVKANENKNFIEISQIREMIDFTNKSSFNSKERIILIDNVEMLNPNALNALLKNLEEPNENIYFILVYDSSKKIKNTLKSRCNKYNLNLTRKQNFEIANKIINNNFDTLINKSLISHYDSPGDIINFITFVKSTQIDAINITLNDFLIKIINEKYYKNNYFIKNNIYKFIELFFLNEVKYDKYNNKIDKFYHFFIKKINNLKNFNLDEEVFFIEFKDKLLNE